MGTKSNRANATVQPYNMNAVLGGNPEVGEGFWYFAARPNRGAVGRSGTNIQLVCSPDAADADLQGADLQGARTTGANLSGADLRGANLRGVDMHHTNFSGADLRGANLEYAKLDGSNFRGADLRGANLHGAWLELAKFAGALLDGAKFTNAHMHHVWVRDPACDFSGADLTGARSCVGLDTPPESWGTIVD